MAKPQNPKKSKKEIVNNVQKQYQDLFSNQDEPPASMSIREEQELRARIAELEAKLGQQEPANPGSFSVLPAAEIPVAQPEPTRLAGKDTQSKGQEAVAEPQPVSTPPTKPPEQEDVISLWRERFLTILLRGTAAVGFVGWFVYLLLDISRRDWGDLTLISTVYAVLIAITFLKVPNVVRSYGLVALACILYLNAVTTAGVRGDADVFLITAVTLAIMLLGLRTGIVVLGLSILVMTGVGWGVINQQLSLHDLFDQLNPSIWVAHGFVADMVATILATGIILLQREFSGTQRRERAAVDEVYRERNLLAQRVEERTHDLELAAEVGQAINEKVANLSSLLSQATDLIRSRFNFYYTQVYLVDPSGRNLTLRAGTGNAGLELLRRGHHLPISSGSLNGRATAERHAVIVEDTQKSSNFLPNPLLPLTRSEMAIPLIANDKVVGVLDMQSERPGTFNESNLPAFEVLAGQLAIAIQNAALIDKVKQAQKELEEQFGQQSSSGWRDYLNAVDRSEKLGFVFSQNEVLPLVETAPSTISSALTAPIQVAGADIGEIQLSDTTERTWTTVEKEIVQATAVNVARHIESLRLLAQAESYRAEAEQATQRLTREGWEEFLEAHQELASGYIYDQNQVHPLEADRQDISKPALSAPLVVREETIGELIVKGETDSAENSEFLEAVAGQLSNHIENLRLSLSNLRLLKSTEERAQREQNLRQITNALRGSTDPETILRTAARELGGMLGRKTVVQMTPLLENVQGESVLKDGNGSDSAAGSPDSTVGG